MASTPVEFPAPAGLTLDLELYPYGSDTIANGAGGDAATEATNRKGRYTATVIEALTGWHHAIILDGSNNLIASFDVYLEDDTAIHRCEDAQHRAYDESDGYAIDWNKVRNPTTTVGLSGTTVKTATDVETDTADIQTRIGTAGAGLTAIPWNTAWDAEVQSECADALIGFNLDHFMGAAVTNTDVVDNSALAKLVSMAITASWSTYSNTTQSLGAHDDEMGDLAVNVDTLNTNVTTLLSRITSTIFAGMTSLAEWLGLMSGKQTPDATALTEIRATGAGSGTYDPATDSQEAISDGGGGSVTVSALTQAALAQFVTDDTGQTTAAAGSVAKIAQGAAGGSVTVAAFEQAALDALAGIAAFAPLVYVNQIKQEVVLVEGDDYLDADGRALTFTLLSGEAWPTDLSALTAIKWSYRDEQGNVVASIDGTVDVATGDSRALHVDVLAASLSNSGTFFWDLQFTDAGAKKWTPRLGLLRILKDATP